MQKLLDFSPKIPQSDLEWNIHSSKIYRRKNILANNSQDILNITLKIQIPSVEFSDVQQVLV